MGCFKHFDEQCTYPCFNAFYQNIDSVGKYVLQKIKDKTCMLICEHHVNAFVLYLQFRSWCSYFVPMFKSYCTIFLHDISAQILGPTISVSVSTFQEFPVVQ